MGPQQTAAKFPHRHNRDGSYDSICPACYATVATAQTEFDLLIYELNHVCQSPFALSLKPTEWLVSNHLDPETKNTACEPSPDPARWKRMVTDANPAQALALREYALCNLGGHSDNSWAEHVKIAERVLRERGIQF